MSWFQELRPASFGGVPFAVYGGEIRVGRRNAVHEYPFKDEVWVEDLGRSARRIVLVGFLVENAAYGGGAVIQQREQLIAACEAPGQKTLVHPTLGSLTVSLLDTSIRESREQGRSFQFTMTFIEGGERTFPAADVSTQDAVAQTCTAADAAAGADFATAVAPTFAAGSSVVSMASVTSSSWASQILSAAGDATNLMNQVAGLQGSFGRFFGSGLRGFVGSVSGLVNLPSSVSDLIAVGTMARAAVSTACGLMSAAASVLGVGNSLSFSVSVQGVVAALLGATTDPGDSMRVCASVSRFYPSSTVPASAVGSAMGVMQSSCGDLFRRAAVVSVCRASASYQPSSYDDAVAIRGKVLALVDSEIQVAGDQGQDATYTALRAVRAAVAQDLTARGANLAKLVTVATPRPIPALTLAQRVYRDSGRADELIAESGCTHPAFMPTSFRALAE